MSPVEEGFQTSASDPDQVAYADERSAARVRRRVKLWRTLMDTSEGREWLFEVLLADLGYLTTMQGSLEDMYGQAALHNLCCRYIAKDIARHHDLWRQMQIEAMKREDEDRRDTAAARARWAREGARND